MICAPPLARSAPLLCSDAGMPCISDPGEQIVKDAIARGITVTPVPGASACVTALAVSGQDTARFVFEGFLPVPKKERRERLDSPPCSGALGRKPTLPRQLTYACTSCNTKNNSFPHALSGPFDVLCCARLAALPGSLWRHTHRYLRFIGFGDSIWVYFNALNQESQ